MQWTGGARRYVPSPEIKTIIIDVYSSGLSVASTQRELLRRGHQVTESGVVRVLKDAGAMRNARQLKGARIKPVYTAVKACEHCGEEFKQAFSRHIYCDKCAPDGKFAKYITKYGIGRREFDLMLIEQSNGCAICSKPLDCAKDTHVDHDHVTAVVRGLLCNFCNTRVGTLEDETFMPRALKYLQECKDYRNRGTCDPA